MFGFSKRQSIADQVSSSLKNPQDWSEAEHETKTPKRQASIAEQVSSSLKNPQETCQAEVIELPPPQTSESDKEEESKTEAQDESNSQEGQAIAQAQQELEECLYGRATRRSPFIPNDQEPTEDGDAPPSPDRMGLNSRWSQSSDVGADYHNIDIAVLRKLCSQGSGIPEEEGPRGDNNNDGDNDDEDSDYSLISNANNAPKTRGTCHRGIAWRVLLEQLATKDIHATWPKELPPQRKLYRELVEKYLEDAIDRGSSLKGESHWEQSLRMSQNSSGGETDGGDKTNQQQQNQNQQDEDSDDAPSALDSSTHIRATEDIYDIFPSNSKYKELWRKSGITLNQGESAAAIKMNRLKVPTELLSEDGENDSGDEKEQNDDDGDVGTADENPDEKPDASGTEDSAESEPSNESRLDDLFEQFIKDAKLLSEIRKDVVRTNPHLRFYLEPRNRLGIRRHAALERILFVWAKLNNNLYVQGMNEIVGTIYYVLAMDPTISGGSSMGSNDEKEHAWADHAEADTYYLFDALLNRMEVRDVFVADLDHDSLTGLHARIKNIEMLLKEHDPELFNHLKGGLALDSSFYAIRWLTTLLSREFRLPDTIRLWDSMLASTHKENFLRYVCATMVMAVRERLLRGDFGTCLKLLQNYPSGEIGMDELLESSRALWIYETQISAACQKGKIPLRQALKLIPAPDGVIMAFGRPGGKPPKLREQIRHVASTTVAVANNNNVGNLVGRAKQLWSWRSPGKKKDIVQIDVSKINSGSADSGDSHNSNKDVDADADVGEWDLIDSIIEGKTEFIAGSGASASSLIHSAVVVPNEEKTTDPSNLVTPPTTPSTSPRKIWGASDLLDDDDFVEDFSNNDGSLSQGEPVDASTNAGLWNRMRRGRSN